MPTALTWIHSGRPDHQRILGEQQPIISFVTPALIFWILIFDMTYITVEKVVTGKVKTVRQWIDYVGTDHFHHRLYALLCDKKKSV